MGVIYERKGRKYSIQEILEKTFTVLESEVTKNFYFEDERIKVTGPRFDTFIKSGTSCVQCGLQGKYFVIERCKHGQHYHNHGWTFQLYGLDLKGNEVQFTKDHIIPKSQGGQNHLDNYQTMCKFCNMAKGKCIPKNKKNLVRVSHQKVIKRKKIFQFSFWERLQILCGRNLNIRLRDSLCLKDGHVNVTEDEWYFNIEGSGL